jgi:hypothetical protein
MGRSTLDIIHGTPRPHRAIERKCAMKSMILAMVLIMGAWVLPVGITQAGSLPSHYPERFSSVGTVDWIGNSGDKIVINDTGFTVAEYVVVHGLYSKTVPFSRIRKGSRIGFFLSSSNNADGGSVIKEIWLLPDDYGQGSEE